MAAASERSLGRRVAGTAVASARRFAWGRVLSQALRVRAARRYLLASVAGSDQPRRYELRDSGLRVILRHGTRDIVTFDEVFCSSAYKPPDHVQRVLRELDRPPRVLDLGANIGLFTTYAMGVWPGAQITAFEPDPGNAAVLRACVALNPGRGTVAIVEAAAAARAGTIAFVTGLDAESHRVHADEQAATVPVAAVDVFAYFADADLAKIDIEGGEWELLGDPRLADRGPRALVLEHHGRHCPGGDPRATATELLTSAGYDVYAQGPAVGGVGMLWALTRRPAREP